MPFERCRPGATPALRRPRAFRCALATVRCCIPKFFAAYLNLDNLARFNLNRSDSQCEQRAALDGLLRCACRLREPPAAENTLTDAVMPTPLPPATQLPIFLQTGGAMGALIGDFDWSTTPLGPLAHWPDSMTATLSLMLHARVPMVILWGREGVMFYNDPYSVFAGKRTRRAWVNLYSTDGPKLLRLTNTCSQNVWQAKPCLTKTRNLCCTALANRSRSGLTSTIHQS